MSEITETVRTGLLSRLRPVIENGDEDALASMFVFATYPTKAVFSSLPPPPGSRYNADSVIDALNKARAVAILKTSIETITLTGTHAVGIANPNERKAAIASLEDSHRRLFVWYALIDQGPGGKMVLGPWVDMGAIDEAPRSCTPLH